MIKQLALIMLLTMSLKGDCLSNELYQDLGMVPLATPDTPPQFLFGGEFYPKNGGICVDIQTAASSYYETKENLIREQRQTMANNNQSIGVMKETMEILKAKLKDIQEEEKKLHDDLVKSQKKLEKREQKIKKRKPGMKLAAYTDLTKMVDGILGFNITSPPTEERDIWSEALTKWNKMDPRFATQSKFVRGDVGLLKSPQPTEAEMLTQMKSFAFDKKEDIHMMSQVMSRIADLHGFRAQALENRYQDLILEQSNIVKALYNVGGGWVDASATASATLKVPVGWVNNMKSDFSTKILLLIDGYCASVPGYPAPPKDCKNHWFKEPMLDSASMSNDAIKIDDDLMFQFLNENDHYNPSAARILEGTNGTADGFEIVPYDKYLHNFDAFSQIPKDIQKYELLRDQILEARDQVWQKYYNWVDAKVSNTRQDFITHFLEITQFQLVKNHSGAIQSQVDEVTVTIGEGYDAYLEMEQAFELLNIIQDERHKLMNEYYDQVYGNTYDEEWNADQHLKELEKTFNDDAKFDDLKDSDKPIDDSPVTPVTPVVKPTIMSLKEIHAILDHKATMALAQYNKNKDTFKTSLNSIKTKFGVIIDTVASQADTSSSSTRPTTEASRINIELDRIKVYNKEIVKKLKVKKRMVKDSSNDLTVLNDALKQVDILKKMWKKMKKFKKHLKAMIKDVATNADIPKWTRLLKRESMHTINLYKVKAFKMELDINSWKIMQFMDGMNFEEIHDMIGQMDTLQFFVEEADMLLQGTLDEGRRDKCYTSQMKLMAGVMMATTCGNASDYVTRATDGTILDVPVDNEAAIDVTNSCIDILFGHCAVVDMIKKMQHISNLDVSIDFSQKSKACQGISEMYSCTLNPTGCPKDHLSHLFLANYAPFINGFTQNTSFKDLEASVIDDLDNKDDNLNIDTEDPDMQVTINEIDGDIENDEVLGVDSNDPLVLDTTDLTDPVTNDTKDDFNFNLDDDLEKEIAAEDGTRRLESQAARIGYSARDDLTYNFKDLESKTTGLNVSNIEADLAGLPNLSFKANISFKVTGDTDDDGSGTSSVLRIVSSTFIFFALIFMF